MEQKPIKKSNLPINPDDAADILKAIAGVIASTGFGEVTIMVRHGEIDEIAVTTTVKPRKRATTIA